MIDTLVPCQKEEQRGKLETKIEFKKGVARRIRKQGGRFESEECDTFSRDPKASRRRFIRVKMSIRAFGRSTLSFLFFFHSASQPPTRPKLHLFEIEGAYSPFSFFPPPLLFLSLSLSPPRFFSSSFLEAPLEGGNRKRITAPNFTAHD